MLHYGLFVLGIPISILIKTTLPLVPFMNRMGVVFLISVAVMVTISLIENKGDDKKAIQLEKSIFHTSAVFNAGAIAITGILAVIYTVFW